MKYLILQPFFYDLFKSTRTLHRAWPASKHYPSILKIRDKVPGFLEILKK